MNHVVLMGRLTKDPEFRQTQSGTFVARFTVAVDRYVKQGDKQTDFINCVAFGKTAEFLQKYFFKGSMIAVEGSIKTGSYDDKKYPEIKHFTADIWVEKVHFCGKAENAQNTAYTGGNAGQGNYTNKVPQVAQAANLPGNSTGFNPADFEEIISDGDLPF